MSSIDFKKAKYTLAAHYSHQWPEDNGAEVAFAGRSNVGKSSAINVITNQNRLAKTSKTPGRTQQIVFFDVEEDIRLVDLPGYGYAKAPEALRKHWQSFISDYLFSRQCLRALVIPMDIRRPLTALDLTMLECCWQTDLPAHVLLTKSDKFNRGKAINTLQSVRKELKSAPLTSVQLFSSLKKEGVDEARSKLNELYRHQRKKEQNSPTDLR
ncbi:MAG: YihA family ribosome biogenesis GTP-binding protein [Gammaproteobacteria bacterium]|nr:YihA family ribosome biogenesis GTP-binding protein [Gammaproteobacteria bacterium]